MADREIKFRRAFFTDRECTKFSHFSVWGVGIGDTVFIAPSTNNFAEYWIDQQFTGLKDKNGKEIFEGDIVSPVLMNGSVSDAEVIWHRGQSLFKALTGERFSDDAFKFCDWVSVVGNIYEHPELLEKEKDLVEKESAAGTSADS
jgi:hypothetical protein